MHQHQVSKKFNSTRDGRHPEFWEDFKQSMKKNFNLFGPQFSQQQTIINMVFLQDHTEN